MSESGEGVLQSSSELQPRATESVIYSRHFRLIPHSFHFSFQFLSTREVKLPVVQHASNAPHTES